MSRSNRGAIESPFPAELSPDPPTDLDGNPMPALLSGTSTEFIGNQPWPPVIQDRPLLLLLGPPGVGKSTVAQHMAGENGAYLADAEVLKALKSFARKRSWPEELINAPALAMKVPCFLGRRPAVVRALQALISARVDQRLRTWVCEPDDGDGVERLMTGVHPRMRATLVLRFPVGRGRRRFALRVCDELGLSASHAKKLMTIDPWTYDSVWSSAKEISTRS